jgi:dTDP-4-dehydrorhamnose reductase
VKLLVFGANSQLGRELGSLLADNQVDVVTLATDELDVLKPKDVVKTVSRINPTQLINVSTYTNLQKAESDPAAARLCELVNTEGVTALARVCEQLGIPMLHHSSSYVFDGKKKETYTEEDEANPQCRYGRSKWYGERALREELEKHIILRTDWLFSRHRSNYFLNLIDTCKKQKGKVSVVDNRFNPTPAADVARVIFGIVKQVDCNANAWGTYHYNAMQPVNQDSFVQHVLDEAAKLDKRLDKIMPDLKLELLPVAAPYIKNSALNCEKLMATFGIKQRTRGSGVIDVIESLYGFKKKAPAPKAKPEATAISDLSEQDAMPEVNKDTARSTARRNKAVSNSNRRAKRPARKAAKQKPSPSP